MTTLGAGEHLVRWRAAARPSIPGIRISISTTSGRWAVTAAIADSPLAASPTTVMPSAASRMTQNPYLTSSWSSTTSTRIGDGALPAGPCPVPAAGPFIALAAGR